MYQQAPPRQPGSAPYAPHVTPRAALVLPYHPLPRRNRPGGKLVAGVAAVVVAAGIGAGALVMTTGNSTPANTAASYQVWADGPSGQAFAATTGAKLNTPAGCATFAANVARISTNGLPEVAVAPMGNVLAAMRDMAAACSAGDEAATLRASGRFFVAIGELSQVPGINPKG